MSTDLINLIDNRIKKFVSGMNILKSKPAKVLDVYDDMVKVKFPDSENPVTVPNYSGNSIMKDSDVLVYCRGNLITKNTAYIGNAKCIGTKTDILSFLECDTQLTGTVLECDFIVSGNSRDICFSGDLVLYSEALQNAEIRYFFDDNELDFAPKISVNGYLTQHLSIFFTAESGEHNFKVVLNSDMLEQVQGKIIGQNIKPVEAKQTTANDYIYEISGDFVTLLYYKGTESRIIIPSEIDGKPVAAIESTCFTDSNVNHVVIPETVNIIY